MTSQRKLLLVLCEARRALGMSQAEFAAAVGSSHRTVVRWEGGESTPAAHHYATLAALLHPRERDLAAEVAAHAGQTLVSLQIESPPLPPAPPPQPATNAAPAPARRHTKPEDLVDIVVLAAVVETGAPPADVRRWLHAVMKRASDVGLTVEEAEKALRPPAPIAEPTVARSDAGS